MKMYHDVRDIVTCIKHLDHQIHTQMEKIKEFLTDEDVPLKDRWGYFEEVEQWLPTDDYVQHFTFKDRKIKWHKDLGYNRGAIVKYKDVIELMIEAVDYADWDKEAEWFTCPALAEFMESILQKGERGFVNDW